MDDVSINIAVLSTIAFAANLVYGLTAFGAAIVFQCSWHIAELTGLASGGINEGTKHIAVLMFFTRAMQAVNLRAHCIRRLAIVMFFICTPSLVLGTLLAYSIPSKTTQVVVGIIFLFILSHNISSKGVRLPPPLKIGDETSMFGGNRNHLYALMLASFASGSLMGICGSPGPPFMVLLTSFASVEPIAWRGTAAVVQWCVGSVQLVLLYFLTGQSFSSTDMIMDTFMIFSGVLGLWVGNLLSPKVNAEWFGKAMIVFLALSAISMITSMAPTYVQLLALLLTAILAITTVACHSFRDNRRAEDARARADAVTFTAIPREDTALSSLHEVELVGGDGASSPTAGMPQSAIERQSLLDT